MGWAVAMLPPPPSERYPRMVYTEYCWQDPRNPANILLAGRVWAMRGSPPGLTSFGSPSASRSAPMATIGSYQERGTPTARFTLSGAPASVPVVLMLGASNQSLAGIPLPFNLAPLCLYGIDLRTSSEVPVPAVTGTGYLRENYARVVLPGRFTASSTGLSLHAQWLWLDPTTRRHGSTAGASFRIQ